MALGENIRAARERKGWTTLELAFEVASRLGREKFSQSNISRYESNDIKPRGPVLQATADALGVPKIVLEYGDSHLLTQSLGTHKVPLIQWGSAAEYISAGPRGHEKMPYLPAKKQYSPKVFGMTVADDSMDPKFEPGYDIIVDPEVKPGPNDFVVARCDGKDWLRQYKERKTGFVLVPLNDGYDSISSEEGATILGTVVEWHIYR